MVSEDEEEIDPDIEERLYAQIHHQEDDSVSAATEGLEGSDLILNLDSHQRRNPNNRYFSDSVRPPPPRFQSKSTFRRPPVARDQTNSVLGMSEISGKLSVSENGPRPVTGYKAYTSVLQQWGTAVNEPATNSGAKNFRKPENVAKGKNIRRAPDAQMSKLVQKYLAKAQKAEMAKKKSKARQKPAVPTISLDSSSEDDDVIEIPVPPPPLVCLDDSSSDDSMQAPLATPNSSRAINAAAMARASRCSSPSSSVISDDFIAPLDRHCLSDSMDSVNMTEEDLRAAGKPRASVAEALNKDMGSVGGSVPAGNTCSASGGTGAGSSKTVRQRIPLLYKNLICSHKDVTIERYHEDEASANDVVLLPAALPEPVDEPPATIVLPETVSITPKRTEAVSVTGKKSHVRTTAQSSSSDSEDDRTVNTRTTIPSKPKEPKRKVQRPEESSDSETVVSVPYIRSGEAVAQAQVSPKRREAKKRQRLSSSFTPQSDNVFISLISTIAQGGDVSDSDSVEILPSTIEEITIGSGDDSGRDVVQAKASASLVFNEFPHGGGLKLVPIEKKKVVDPWHICDADRLGPQPVARIKCLNCHQMGHIRARCNVPYTPPQCYMCGEQGHREPRCQKTICLQCGSPTNTFQIRCRDCHQMSNTRCRSCWAIGHTDWLCPEKWRRYHSTTEDSVKLKPLKGPLIRRAKYCSVCARRGHAAEECRMASAFLDFRAAPMGIVRYESIYPPPHVQSSPDPPVRYVKPSPDPVVRLQKSLEIKTKRERMQEKRPRESQQPQEANDAVHEINKSTALLEDQPTAAESNQIVDTPGEVVLANETLVESVANKEQQPNALSQDFKITVDVQSDERLVTSTTKTNEGAVDQVTRKLSPNSDSNYSFSDFFDKEKILATTSEPLEAPSPAEDFLSLKLNCPPPPMLSSTSQDELSSQAQVTSTRLAAPQSNNAFVVDSSNTEARILLSKEHSKILINSSGSKFLQDMSQVHNVRVRLEWQAVGNLLTIRGLGTGLTNFHVDLTKFLTQEDDRNAAKLAVNPLPKMREALVRFIAEHIQLLETPLGNVYDLYRKIQEHEKYGGGGKKSSKNAERAQRKLNMILMGQAGLRDGRKRLNELKRCQEQLIRDPAPTAVAVELREEIEKNFRYIFSSVRHDNYPDLLNRYGAWRRSSRQHLSLNNTRSPRSGGRVGSNDNNRIKRLPPPASKTTTCED